MNERIKQVRLYAGLNQTEFGKRLGVKQNSVSRLEACNRQATDQILTAICREFGVSRHWLETGEGDMIDPQTVTDIEQLTRAMEGQCEAKKAILRAVALMPDDLLELVYRYLQDALK